MLRTFLIEGALFLTPFLLYAAVLVASRGSAMPAHWTTRGLALVGIAAILMMVLGLWMFEHGEPVPDGVRYVPAQMRDGVLVPGHFE